MSFLIRFKNYIDEREPKSFYRGLGILLGCIILLFILLFYWHANTVAALQKELKTIQKGQKEIRVLLGEYEHVMTQRATIKTILDEDSAFRIKQYVDQSLRELNLLNKVSKEEVSEPKDLQNGYNEIKLDISFAGMTMQDLVNLLDGKIEKSKRMYTKELVITKTPGSRTFDVTLVLATLQSRPTQL